MSKEFNINYRNIDIMFCIKKVKRYSIKVLNGDVFFYIPESKSRNIKKAINDAKRFIDEKYTWILKSIEKTKDQKEIYNVENIKGEDDEKILVLGNIYNLVYLDREGFNAYKDKYKDSVVNSNLQKIIDKNMFKYIFIIEDDRTIYLNSEAVNDKKEYIRNVFKEIIRDIGLKLIKKWEIILNIKSESLKITSGKGNWGSCNTKKGYINLNFNLVYKNIKEIEYVVLHELCHLFYPNHGKEFKNMMTEYMPDWKQRKKDLNKKV